MKKLLITFVVLAFAGVAVAEMCPICKNQTKPTYRYCGECGFDLVTWRNSNLKFGNTQSVPTSWNKQSNVYSPPEKKTGSYPERSERWRKYGYGTRGPDGVTPIMLTVIGGGPGFGIFGNPGIIVYGLDLGVIGTMTYEVYGLSVASFFNAAHEVYGLKIASLFNIYDYMYGIQIGSFNISNPGYGAGVAVGMQIGILNESNDMTGLQIGFANKAEKMCGVQIGVLNFINESPLSFFPVINMCF